MKKALILVLTITTTLWQVRGQGQEGLLQMQFSVTYNNENAGLQENDDVLPFENSVQFLITIELYVDDFIPNNLETEIQLPQYLTTLHSLTPTYRDFSEITNQKRLNALLAANNATEPKVFAPWLNVVTYEDTNKMNAQRAIAGSFGPVISL